MNCWQAQSCLGATAVWVPMYNGHAISRDNISLHASVSSDFCILSTLLLKYSLILGVWSGTDVPLRAKHPTVTYAQLFDPVWVSTFSITLCKKLFRLGLRAVQIYEHKQTVRRQFDSMSLSRTSVVGSPLGPSTALAIGRAWLRILFIFSFLLDNFRTTLKLEKIVFQEPSFNSYKCRLTLFHLYFSLYSVPDRLV